MNLARFVIFLTAGFFLLYGLAFSLVPVGMAMLVTGNVPEGVSALVDFRATYGGLALAVGLLLFYLHSIQQVRACLVVVILVLLSMAATRTLGMLVDGSGNALMYLYLAGELLGVGLALLAMQRRTA